MCPEEPGAPPAGTSPCGVPEVGENSHHAVHMDPSRIPPGEAERLRQSERRRGGRQLRGLWAPGVYKACSPQITVTGQRNTQDGQEVPGELGGGGGVGRKLYCCRSVLRCERVEHI